MWNPEYTLSDFQEKAVDAVIKAWFVQDDGEGPFDKVLLVAATGAGKTIMASRIIYRAVTKGAAKALFLCDRDELVSQAVDKIYKTSGFVSDIEKAESYASMDADVVVASIQSISKDERLHRFQPGHFKVIVADEAHLSMAKTWQKVLGHLVKDAKVVGVTATPARADRQSLLKYYETIAAKVDLFELIEGGHLVPILVKECILDIDLKGVSLESKGEDMEEVAKVLLPYHNEIITKWEESAKGLKTLWFHPSRASSRAFADRLRERGYPALHIDGESKDRKSILSQYKESDGSLHLTNAKLLTVGYDEPTIRCIANCRGTKSKTEFQQIMGRGTRLFCPNKCRTVCGCEGAKYSMTFLDFFSQFAELGIMSAADLLTDDPDLREAVAKRVKNGEELSKAQKGALGDLENSFIKKLSETRRGSRGEYVYDARLVMMAVAKDDLKLYRPESRWEKKKPTDRQMDFLVRGGIDADTVKTRGEASVMIETLHGRIANHLATIRQIALLTKLGVTIDPKKTTMKEASELISEKLRK